MDRRVTYGRIDLAHSSSHEPGTRDANSKIGPAATHTSYAVNAYQPAPTFRLCTRALTQPSDACSLSALRHEHSIMVCPTAARRRRESCRSREACAHGAVGKSPEPRPPSPGAASIRIQPATLESAIISTIASMATMYLDTDADHHMLQARSADNNRRGPRAAPARAPPLPRAF